MVFKGNGPLSFPLFPRLGFGSSHRSDSPSQPRNAGRREDDWYIPYNGPYEEPNGLNNGKAEGRSQINVATDNVTLLRHFASPPDDVHTGSTGTRRTLRTRARTMPTPVLVIQNTDGGIGESPIPLHRSVLPVPPKRSSRMGFFAFSSNRKNHGPSIIQMPPSQQVAGSDLGSVQPMPGGWHLGKAHAHLADPSVIPSALRTEDQDYYYTYYSTLIPSPDSPSSRLPDADNPNIALFNRSPSRHLNRNGNSGPDSQQSSPVEFYSPTLTQTQHPYAYTPSLPPQPQHPTKSSEPLPLRHATSQQIQQRQQGTVSGANLSRTPFSPEPGTRTQGEASELQQGTPLTPLRTSMSVPNLSSTTGPNCRPVTGTKVTTSVTKSKQRWLSAETWCDALLFPRPRFKVEQGPGKYASSSQRMISPPITPVEGHVTWNSSSRQRATSTGRPRAASATVNGPRIRRVLTKSRSTAELLLGPKNSVVSHVGVEFTMDPQADEQLLTQGAVEQDPLGQLEHSSVTPPPSLTQVLEEGETLVRQREQWRLQAAKSLGNSHARSMSRARSKSLSEKQARVLRKPDNSKGESNFDFLVTRTLLGSQSVTPTIHVAAKRRTASLHSKSYSHCPSHSRTQTNLSCTQSHGHSQSHSMSTSHSSKSSRNLNNLGHSRSESWGKTALLKAGSLCGGNSKDSPATPVDAHAVSSRAEASIVLDLRGDGGLDDGNVDRKGISPSPSVPSREGVGIAISSPLPFDQDSEALRIPRHPYAHPPSHSKEQEISANTEGEIRRTSKYTHKSSDYAGPHPSTFDPNLSPPTTTSDVSLRHRLPPRAAVQVPHPYASALAQPGEQAIRPQALVDAPSSLPATTSELFAERDFDPHISISNADFERYGVGEALVYASLPKSEVAIRQKENDGRNALLVDPASSSLEAVESQSSPVDDDNCRERSPSPPVAEWTSVFPNGGQSPASQEDVSNVTLQQTKSAHMLMASFGSAEDLEEFKDLFYKPPALSSSGSQQIETNLASNGIPFDVQSSRSSGSALTNLVRSLSDEITELKNSSRILSDTMSDSTFDSRIHQTLSDSDSNQAILDSAILSSSPGATELLANSRVEQEGAQAVAAMPVPEDAVSSSECLVLDALTSDENDTFGYPIRRGPVEVVPSSPKQTPRHISTHPSILEGLEVIEEPTELLSPTARSFRSNPGHSEAVRASYMTTTSDNSRMSGLSDFPLPPTTHPDFIRTRNSFGATPLPTDPHNDARPRESSSIRRATTEAVGYESHRTTFGGNEEVEIGIEVHRSIP
ncbi:hypothetical protein F5I97DRAFT_1927401 [Phlebopus sp. FC_14]|nr:hypothetical protein F5I97DRAFT_1927401 [Phlebopus sp. FC_14]